jgi:hypothetical protein
VAELKKKIAANFDSKKSDLLKEVRKAVFQALEAALAEPDVTAMFALVEEFDSDDLKDALAGHVRTSVAASLKLQGVLDGVVEATQAIINSHPYFINAEFVGFDDAAAASAGLTISHITGIKETATRTTRKTFNKVCCWRLTLPTAHVHVLCAGGYD